MLNIQIHENIIRIVLEWRPLLIDIHLYVCKNSSRSLDNEIKLRGISHNTPIAIIPVTIVKTPFQLIQGAVHYAIYSNKITRIKNQGLLIASLVTGIHQLNELIDKLETEIGKGVDYYVLGVNIKPENIDKCEPYIVSNLKDEPIDVLVKNVKYVISLV